jgi:hypothetical protein
MIVKPQAATLSLHTQLLVVAVTLFGSPRPLTVMYSNYVAELIEENHLPRGPPVSNAAQAIHPDGQRYSSDRFLWGTL